MTEDQLHSDHCGCTAFFRMPCKLIPWPSRAVLSAEDASLIAMEFGLNPVVDEERSFDIYPE